MKGHSAIVEAVNERHDPALWSGFNRKLSESTPEVNAVSVPSKNERVDLRLPMDQKRLIEQAATLSGLTVSGFILGSTLQRAREVLRETTIIELSGRDRDRFLAALDDEQAKPGPTLRRAARRHKQMLG
jgi:uncharacterized protein (DUF1778 family)